MRQPSGVLGAGTAAVEVLDGLRDFGLVFLASGLSRSAQTQPVDPADMRSASRAAISDE